MPDVAGAPSAPESRRSFMTGRDRALAAIHVTIFVAVVKIGIFPYSDFEAWRQTGTTTEPARLKLHCVEVASIVWRLRLAGITSSGTKNLAWPRDARNQRENRWLLLGTVRLGGLFIPFTRCFSHPACRYF